jgi:hypothetical protein
MCFGDDQPASTYSTTRLLQNPLGRSVKGRITDQELRDKAIRSFAEAFSFHTLRAPRER